LEGASDSCPELALPELAAEAFLLHIQTQGIDRKEKKRKEKKRKEKKRKEKKRKEKKRKDYAFWRQFNERPSIILGCPVLTCSLLIQTHGDGFLQCLWARHTCDANWADCKPTCPALC